MKSKKVYFLILVTIVFISYQFFYKRHFVYSKDGAKVVTIWETIEGDCYIIGGKYYGLFKPTSNFIKTSNNTYIGIVWNTGDSYKYKISFYTNFQSVNLDSNVKVYTSNDLLLNEYGFFKSYDLKRGLRVKNENFDILKRKYDYCYIDLRRIYGLKIR